jgi:nucleoid-associated protein YgaU
MKRAIVLAQFAVVAVLVVGCADDKKTMPRSGAALDITPPSATPAHPQAYAPAPAQPVTVAPADSTPVVTAAPAAGVGATASASTGGSYTVKKGDTLYSIARSRYGDGKQYTRIVAANPGLSPTSLKVGQSITIP